MIYAFGSNGSGQLGLGHANDISTPANSRHGRDQTSTTVRQIAAGGNHTLILEGDGHISAYGSNDCGQTSSKSVRLEAAHPNLLPSVADTELDIIAQVSATWNASIYLRRSGEVATSGEGLSGELGLGRCATRAPYPQTVPDFPPQGASVVQLASSMAHTVVVLDNGEVYGWGKGRKGQLGKPAEDVFSPRKIEGIPFPAVKAVCGTHFTCIVGNHAEGNLVILGYNSRDRFGLVASIPATVPGLKDIAASWGSLFVLKQNGELLGFGRDDHGQLPSPDIPLIEAIAAGSEHCLALTKAGKVLAWGWGEHGNCGEPTDYHGDVKSRWNEIDLPPSQKVTAVYAGCATSFIVTASDH
ncbi:hypothetical protein LTR36_008245 [Oleoguttula mirabilis]|uniref:RCC1-like domain-containing protein n=1 Tax=Oleoguttula mirabilis TaxID=1507867 RepID=A0AAV9J8K7_9PEZI|nr:hypothetical protein LTR36_008245 [Oleoguttula mirabilis]